MYNQPTFQFHVEQFLINEVVCPKLHSTIWKNKSCIDDKNDDKSNDNDTDTQWRRIIKITVDMGWFPAF